MPRALAPRRIGPGDRVKLRLSQKLTLLSVGLLRRRRRLLALSAQPDEGDDHDDHASGQKGNTKHDFTVSRYARDDASEREDETQSEESGPCDWPLLGVPTCQCR